MYVGRIFRVNHSLVRSPTYLQDISKAYKHEETCEGESTLQKGQQESHELGLWLTGIASVHLLFAWILRESCGKEEKSEGDISVCYCIDTGSREFVATVDISGHGKDKQS